MKTADDRASGMPPAIFGAPRRLAWIRVLILLEFVAILVSTSAAVLIEALIYLVLLTSPDLLRRLWAIRHQPMIRLTLAWVLVLAAGCLYTIAPREDLIDILSSWRKLLLLPIAAACFGDPAWKRRAMITFLAVLSLLLFTSCLTWALGLQVHRYQEQGIIVANHAAQGMAFAVCLLLGLVTAREYRHDRLKRCACLLASAVAFLNIAFVTPGRSGYLALMAILAAYILFSTAGAKKYRVFLLMGLAVALALNFSPTARERIQLGLAEIQSYRDSPRLTSMGARMVAWETSLDLVRRKPLVGYGSAAYVEAYRKAVAGRSGWQGEVIEDPHNQFLRILVEHGLVGLCVFLGFIGAFFRQPAGPPFRTLGLCVLLTWCATSLFSSHFTTFLEGRFLLLWLGIFLSGSPPAPQAAATLAAKG
jgi:O-antigen ligase